MGKRKELKDGDVEMGGTKPPADDDSSSDSVRRPPRCGAL